MEHASPESSWPMTLRALGGPPPSQSKCQTSRAPFISHSKEECPCAPSGKAGWVPTIFHSPTRTSNCFIELIGCGGRWACSFMCILLLVRQELRVPGDFPDMAIWILEIASVPPIERLLCRFDDPGPGAFRLFHHQVDFFFAADILALPRIWGFWNCRAIPSQLEMTSEAKTPS